MNSVRRAAVLKFASAAYEMGLERFTGILSQDEAGQWTVGKQSLESWLSAHEGEDVVVVMSSLADDRPVMTRTCHTCGRDYTEMECPTCRANRIRLRGSAY